MRVRGLVWVGIDSPEYAEMLAFIRRLGEPAVVFEEAGTAEFEFADGTRAQLTRSTGSKAVVPLFEIEGDIGEARQELIDAGLSVGDVGDDGAWQWCVVDAPDGQRFEIGRRR